MASAQFDYKNPFSKPSVGDWFSDTFLGTQNAQNKNNSELLNYQNKFNEYMMDKANAYNTEMSNTAYQRAVQDMTAAGINPVVAFSGGAKGASTPSSAQANSASGSAGKLNFAGSIIGSNTAKLVNSGVNRLLRNTIDNDEQLLKSLNVASKFI